MDTNDYGAVVAKQRAFINELNSWARKTAETPPCFADRYNFGRNSRRGWAVHVSLDKQVAVVPECVRRKKKRVACPSRSRYQYFPSHVTPTYNYFQMIVVPTLFVYHGTKTFQIGFNTFQLLVPKLSRSVPLHSNSQYQNFPSRISRYQNFSDRFHYFPTHSTKTFLIFCWFLCGR